MSSQSINNQVAVSTWEEIGSWWDEQMLEGDTFHTHLVHPYVIDLLDLTSNDVVVDLACGNGGLTRKISQITKYAVLGLDCSNSLLAGAQSRETNVKIKNHYEQMDLTNEDDLQKRLKAGNFNKAVCSMAIQDIENIQPMISAVKKTLAKDGVFVISIPHPCFNSGKISFKLADENDADKDQGILHSTYTKPVKLLVYAKENQPKPHPHFHRPLNLLLNEFFSAGFVLDGMREPVFSENELKQIGNDFLWAKFPEIPPVMILRFVAR